MKIKVIKETNPQPLKGLWIRSDVREALEDKSFDIVSFGTEANGRVHLILAPTQED